MTNFGHVYLWKTLTYLQLTSCTIASQDHWPTILICCCFECFALICCPNWSTYPKRYHRTRSHTPRTLVALGKLYSWFVFECSNLFHPWFERKKLIFNLKWNFNFIHKEKATLNSFILIINDPRFRYQMFWIFSFILKDLS